MKIVRYCIQVVLGIALPLLVQLWDRRRLTAEERARAWNTASWGAALYAFGPLSLFGWFWVTRQRAEYFIDAIFAVLFVFIAVLALDATFAWAFHLESPFK